MPRSSPRSKSGHRLAQWGLVALAGCALWKAASQFRTCYKNQKLQRGQRILILGAGFGGREVALTLARELPNGSAAEIILVDQDSFLLFTPMLTEAAGGELDPEHIVCSAARLPRRITFRQASVKEIDLKSRRVRVQIEPQARGIPNEEQVFEADQLVLALGSTTNYHGVPGLEEHSYTIKSVDDAVILRQRVATLLRRANQETDPKLRQELLTIVVAGAGYTGLETMAALNDLIRESVRRYPGLQPEQIRTVLVDPGERVLPELTAKLAGYARHELECRGVELRLKTKVTAAGEDYVEFNGHERLSTRTVVWAGGVKPNALIEALPAARSRHGALVVDSSLAVPDFSGVWALGDCAAVPKQEGGTYAPTAQNAVREGALVGRNIAAVLRGEKPQPFKFKPLGELALVGHHAGVARVLGIPVWGLPAWLMWRVIYWSKMPSFGQRLRILTDWWFDLVFGRDPILGSPLAVGRQTNASVPERTSAVPESTPR